MQGPFLRDPLTEPGGARTPWEEMLAYVDFSSDDAARLLALLPFAEGHFYAITERFYARILGFPGARAVLTHEGQVERLKGTLRAWMADLLRGPHDLTYWQKRRRIGQVHVRVGLPERYVFTALNLIRQDLCEIAAAALVSAEVLPTCHALLKITDLEMAVMSGAYHEAHEERRLRSLQDLIVQNLPVTVLCLDENGRVTSATRPSSRLLGATAEVGRHYETFLPESLIEAADLHTHVGRALATGHEISIPRAVLGTKDQARHFRLTLVPLDHELARLLIHIEELTDVVRAEHRLNQAEALARIGGLAAHLAHEIRNPLAAISATLQVITASFPPEDRRRTILGKVQDQVHRLDRLVSDLLGYARPVAARLERLDLAQVTRDAISQSNVDCHFESVEHPFARADAQYLSQVLVNLLQNASEAMSHLDPKPSVRVRLVTGPAIEVCDQGPGIHADVRDRLFEPFVTTKTKGTGLGLAISRKLMIGMGGNLVLADHAGPGACFRIELNEAT